MKFKSVFKYLSVLLVCLGCSIAYAVEGNTCRQDEKSVRTATFGHIDAKALKGLVESKIPMTLLDGRGGSKWDDGRRIPGAVPASHEMTAAQLLEIAPDKNGLVVVYCGAYECPLGRTLAEKLVQFGYKNVLEYPGGIREWTVVAQYPIQTEKE